MCNSLIAGKNNTSCLSVDWNGKNLIIFAITLIIDNKSLRNDQGDEGKIY